jgi:hypothetical protein
MNSIKKAALLLAMATPMEIWAGIELANREYIIGIPLMLGAIFVLYIGTIKFSCGLSDTVEKDIKSEFGSKKEI